MSSPAAFLTHILTGLQAVIAAHAARDRAQTAFLVFLWGRLARAKTRFQRLFDRWRAGTLPAQRPSRAGRPYTPATTPRLPSARAWFLRRIQGGGTATAQLANLLAQPDLADFLRAAPQAGRILRPLWRMLSPDHLPAIIALPPRPPRPPSRKPASPPTPSPPTSSSQPATRPLPTYVRAAVRAWRTRAPPPSPRQA